MIQGTTSDPKFVPDVAGVVGSAVQNCRDAKGQYQASCQFRRRPFARARGGRTPEGGWLSDEEGQNTIDTNAGAQRVAARAKVRVLVTRGFRKQRAVDRAVDCQF